MSPSPLRGRVGKGEQGIFGSGFTVPPFGAFSIEKDPRWSCFSGKMGDDPLLFWDPLDVLSSFHWSRTMLSPERSKQARRALFRGGIFPWIDREN